ncbi:MAG: PQQ-binding-like beta-propeller repeat protein [Thermomicrobiales bacterium]|nr:PQQ-binding-like beta-propeller repeat protein [Thermomicrobiales bacterium]
MLHAFDASNGAGVWEHQLDEFVRAVPILSGSTLYVADNGGFVRAISANTGQEIWSYPIQGGVNFALTVAGDVVYTGTDAGNLYAITGSDSIIAPSAFVTDEKATPAASPAPAAVDSGSGQPIGTVVMDATLSGGAEPLDQPQDATISPDGLIWVTDGGNDQFQIFDVDGAFVEFWGESGEGEGQFRFTRSNGDPMGAIAFAADGSFYVADVGNARVQHFDAERNFLGSWGERGTGNGQFISPAFIVVDSQGNVWIGDDLRDDLQKFDAAGNWLLTTAGSGSGEGQLNYQRDTVLGLDDTIWVADPEHRRIQQWSSDGSFIQAITYADIPGRPVWVQSIVVDESGNLILADIDGARLFVLDPDGEVQGVWSLTYPDGSLIQNSGYLAIVGENAFVMPDWEQSRLILFHLDPPLG